MKQVDIRHLVDLKTAAQYVMVTPEKLKTWVDQKICPFYLIDGTGPFFGKLELARWIGEVVTERNDPPKFPKVLSIFSPIKVREEIPPQSISDIKSLQILQVNGARAGIYFLVDGEEVVYVGKAKRIMARIADHLREGKKIFDINRVYFLGVPEDMLDDLEQQFIMGLKPKYNNGGR